MKTQEITKSIDFLQNMTQTDMEILMVFWGFYVRITDKLISISVEFNIQKIDLCSGLFWCKLFSRVEAIKNIKFGK